MTTSDSNPNDKCQIKFKISIHKRKTNKYMGLDPIHYPLWALTLDFGHLGFVCHLDLGIWI